MRSKADISQLNLPHGSETAKSNDPDCSDLLALNPIHNRDNVSVTVNSRRAMAMSPIYAKDQGQRPNGSKATVKTDGLTTSVKFASL